MSNKCLITGAGGFIGSHLLEALLKRGRKVKALVHYNSFNRWGWLDYLDDSIKESIEIISGDIIDPFCVKKAMEGCNKVYHLAALIGIPYSYYSPNSYVYTNIHGTLNVLQSARELNIEKVVHTSTSEIYGTAQFVPIAENHPINPQSPYAASKAGADLLALSFYRSFDLPVIVVRPFNTYGPRQSARAVIPTIVTQILAGRKEITLGSLEPTRDLTYVEDTVMGFIKAGESGNALGEVINLGNNNEISIRDLANLIAKIMGVNVTIKEDVRRKRPIKSEVDRLMADNSKAQKLLKWFPEYSFEDGLKKTISWFEKNYEMYKSDIYNI